MFPNPAPLLPWVARFLIAGAAEDRKTSTRGVPLRRPRRSRRGHETRHADAGRQKLRRRPVPRQRRGDVQRRDMVEKPTDTNDTPWASKISISRAKSVSERVSRSTL